MPKNRHIRSMVMLTFAAVQLVPLGSTASESIRPGANGALLALQRAADGPLSVLWAPELHAATGIRALRGRLAPVQPGDATERATAFLGRYGAALGVTDQRSLHPVSDTTDIAGGQHVRFDQRHDGVPVFGARINVHLRPAGVFATSGAFAPVDAVATRPTVSAANARRIAGGDAGTTQAATLTVLHTGLTRREPGGIARLAWAVEVGLPREAAMVFIDASDGAVLKRLRLTHQALNRLVAVRERSWVDLDVNARAEGEPPHLVPAVNNLYDHSGSSYMLFAAAFGRDGFDGAGARMQANLTRHLCPNAYWDGSTTNYCPGFDIDDVVGHEWTHAYTQYTHGLIYQCQSGALNESYSDIFGETLDLLNGRDGDGGHANDQPYPRGQRWLIAEDLLTSEGYVFGRDMWDPARMGDPGRLSDATLVDDEGECTEVHENSAIANHAYAMLVDGTTYNGVTVRGVGLVKALHIYYQAMIAYQGPSTTFAEHRESLLASCGDLLGIDLPRPLVGGPSGERLTIDDCEQVGSATDAVEMNLFRRAVILGRVTDARTGDGLKGSSVAAFDGNGQVTASVFTDPDGTYRLEGLSAGAYTVRFYGSGSHADQWYGGGADADSARPVVLDENGTAVGIDAALDHREVPAPTVGSLTVERIQEGPNGLPVWDVIRAQVVNRSPAPTEARILARVCPDVGLWFLCSYAESDPLPLAGSGTLMVEFDWRAQAFVGTARIHVELAWPAGYASGFETTTDVVAPAPSVGVNHVLTWRDTRAA